MQNGRKTNMNRRQQRSVISEDVYHEEQATGALTKNSADVAIGCFDL
jgi:hypothetical protein